VATGSSGARISTRDSGVYTPPDYL
jgi:hypothetical protein